MTALEPDVPCLERAVVGEFHDTVGAARRGSSVRRRTRIEKDPIARRGDNGLMTVSEDDHRDRYVERRAPRGHRCTGTGVTVDHADAMLAEGEAEPLG